MFVTCNKGPCTHGPSATLHEARLGGQRCDGRDELRGTPLMGTQRRCPQFGTTVACPPKLATPAEKEQNPPKKGSSELTPAAVSSFFLGVARNDGRPFLWCTFRKRKIPWSLRPFCAEPLMTARSQAIVECSGRRGSVSWLAASERRTF